MVNFYIKVKDGQAISNPIHEQNIKMFVVDLDPNSLPEGLEKFEIIDPPSIGFFEYYNAEGYKKREDGVWVDNYVVVPYTEQEKQDKIQHILDHYVGYKGWVFDEERLMIAPPRLPPDDGMTYTWASSKEDWVLADIQLKGWKFSTQNYTYVPPVSMPMDEHVYSWDNETMNWVITE
jgi:hypothetical protein